ncbi:MAG: hypothetical protein M0Z31_01550 [Clostridia bacterium]|nr:hypothetical protein [Clostridia bacterium]
MEKFIKYGGVHFTNNVPPEEINNFVRQLPAEKRDSLFEVVKELEDAGLITLDQSLISTADDETIEYQTT